MVKEREFLALRKVLMFSSLSREHLHLLSSVASIREYPKNHTVLASGDMSDSLYIILSGSVKVGIVDQDGKEVILSFLNAGDVFGEMALIDDNPRSADIVTRDACEMLVIEKHNFIRCLEKSSDLAMQIMRNLVKKLRDADRKIESLALVNVYGRVAQALLEMAEKEEGCERVINKKLSRADLARLVGASREMVTRVMSDLTEGGYISIQGKTIALHAKLATYAHEIGRAQKNRSL